MAAGRFAAADSMTSDLGTAAGATLFSETSLSQHPYFEAC